MPKDTSNHAETEGTIRVAYYQSITLNHSTRSGLFWFDYETHDAKWSLTDEGRDLQRQLNYALHLLNTYAEHCTPDMLERHSKTLEKIAQQGLMGPNANPSEGLAKIGCFQSSFMSTLQKERSRFARDTTCWSILILVASLVLAAFFWLFGKNFAEDLQHVARGALPLGLTDTSLEDMMRALFVFFYGGVGLALGEIFTAKRDGAHPSYESFEENPRFRFSPVERWIFVIACWAILLYLISNDWIVLGIGETQINQVLDKPLTAPLLGILTTVSFNKMIDAISSRTERGMARGTGRGAGRQAATG